MNCYLTAKKSEKYPGREVFLKIKWKSGDISNTVTNYQHMQTLSRHTIESRVGFHIRHHIMNSGCLVAEFSVFSISIRVSLKADMACICQHNMQL